MLKRFSLLMVSLLFIGLNSGIASQGNVTAPTQQQTIQNQKAAPLTIFKTAKKAQKTDAAPKSQLVALVLAIVLGMLGIHRFYLGYMGRGLLLLLLSTIGALVIVGPLIALVLVVFDAINIYTGKLLPKDGSAYDPNSTL